LGGLFPVKTGLAATIAGDLANFAAAKGQAPSSIGARIDAALLPGAMAVILFRLASWCHRHRLRPLSRLLYILNLMLFGVDLAPGLVAGPGLVIPHPVGVVIAARAVLGRNVRVLSGVTIGGGGGDERDPDAMPIIGDECWILSGAKVLGNVEIGHHAVVAAAAVVLDSAPPGSVVAGIPATMRRFRDGFGPPRSALGMPSEAMKASA
jgi:serine O-acetyltransferase